MQQKTKYGRYDFINKGEEVYAHFSRGNDGLLTHSHDFYELVMITEGHGTHMINDISYHVLPGDVFLLIPADSHSFIPIEPDTRFSWLSCIWLPEFYDITDDTLIHTKKFTDEYTYDIYNLLSDFHTEFYAKRENFMEILHRLLEVILLKMKRLANQNNDNYGHLHKKKLIRKAITYLNENYNKPMELKDVADHLRISQVYLCKLFKSELQMGAMQYLKKIRIEKTAQLLSATDLKIDQIASEVGFTDIKSLYSLFKKVNGVSPSVYRKHFNH